MNKSLRRNQADWQSKVADLEKQIEDKNKVKRFNFGKKFNIRKMSIHVV